MAKWADYLVTGVRFNTHGTHIDWLRCRQDKDTEVGPFQDFSRQSVIDAINKGITFITVTVDPKTNLYLLGQKLYAYAMTAHFLKTRADTSTKDNLDNLPTF